MTIIFYEKGVPKRLVNQIKKVSIDIPVYEPITDEILFELPKGFSDREEARKYVSTVEYHGEPRDILVVTMNDKGEVFQGDIHGVVSQLSIEKNLLTERFLVLTKQKMYLRATYMEEDEVVKTTVTTIGKVQEAGRFIYISVNPDSYALEPDDIAENTRKVFRHEMAHSIIEEHCTDDSCLMSELIGDGDVEQKNSFCTKCQSQIDEAI